MTLIKNNGKKYRISGYKIETRINSHVGFKREVIQFNLKDGGEFIISSPYMVVAQVNLVLRFGTYLIKQVGSCAEVIDVTGLIESARLEGFVVVDKYTSGLDEKPYILFAPSKTADTPQNGVYAYLYSRGAYVEGREYLLLSDAKFKIAHTITTNGGIIRVEISIHGNEKLKPTFTMDFAYSDGGKVNLAGITAISDAYCKALSVASRNIVTRQKILGLTELFTTVPPKFEGLINASLDLRRLDK